MLPSTPRELPRSGLNSRARSKRLHAMATLLLLLSGRGSLAQPRPSEFDVKAEYLFNFGRLLRLTGTATVSRPATFDLCVLGQDPISHALEEIAANETIDHRPVHVAQIADAYEARGCEVVFISSGEGDGIHADLAAIGNADVLTVSDAPGFLKNGGMIQFVLLQRHVRFAVNLDAVNRTHLVLSSELLRVAMSVTGKLPEDQR